MFERFTEKAIKVILLAQEEARRLGHNFVGVEFIFLGLIGEATGIASQVLRQQGITLKNARIEVEKILGRGSGMITVEPPFTESAKLVLNNAVSIARQLEHESINTEHLLIGIIQEGESTARILQNLQVNPQDLAISLIQYFQQQSSNQLPQTVYVLLYNVGTDNEGIHTITDQEKQTILMFESSADATNFARQLRKQNFPVPSVEGMSVEEIISFCEEVGYDWEFVPEGANKIPPIESRESGNTHEEYLNFLMKALNKVYENPDPKYIYPFFEHNLDKLDESLIIILNNWAKNQLASVETEQAIYIAGNICDFSTLIQQFSLGNIATNLEIAIAGYQVVLTGFNFDAFPEVWADTQDNLASAYQNRIRGNIAENLELSIAAYTEALKVRTFDKFPKDWADTQNNLANTYAKRIRGDKAENLELAIAAYTEALKVRTFDNSPEDWATTQHNLALAYSNRIRGDKAENLELSIATCNEALKVRTIDRIPLGWANTKNTLAGNYADRIKGDKAENLELAIKLYNEVLQVRTYDKFPWGWAGTQVDLANAYAKRIREDKEDNLEKSINYCQEALRFYTFDTHPQQWAATKNNLAISYLDRIKENKEDNLELAIAALIESLKVTTFDEFPQQWAITQLNLGNAFHKRIKGDKVKNLEKAIECYNNALKILTKDNDPLSCLKPADNLGQLYYKQKQWQLAIESYNIAIEAIENIRLEAFNPQRRQEILADRIEIFHRIVLAHLKLNQPEKALEYIERSKTRNLVELMTQKNIKPQGVSQEIIDQLDELRQRWVNEQIRLQSRSINQNISSNDKLMPYISDDSHLREYRQAWEDFIDEKITPIDPSFKQTQIVQPISFTDIQSLTDAETCLLQWYITGEKILAFVVPSNGDIKYWESSETDLQTFFDTVGNYLQLYDDFRNHKNTQWKNKLSNLLQTFADTLNLNGILALIPDTCQRLIIIPHRFLHILPLHALPVSDSPLFNGGRGKSELHDLFPKGVQYAPSCQLLKIAQQRQLNDLNQLFAIQNPTKDLTFTDLEVNIISTLFNQSEIIAKDHATKDNVTSHLKASDSHCHHFSCHGGFNPGNSLDSALLLANKELLTLGEIFELNFKKSRLVVLSACETGLIDLNSISDEYVGLPSGFLFAGSPSVVSSLWTVNDLSTSFLMIKLYEILFDENQQVSVPVALKQAQYWLQDLTIDKLDEFLQQYQPQIDKHLVQLRPGQRKIYQKSLERIRERQPYPFANPYYWAGFTATGI